MRTFCSVGVLLCLAATPASADCPVDKSVSLHITCKANMLGGGTTLTLSDRSQAAPLEVTGPLKLVTLKFGDYWLNGGLSCSGERGKLGDWKFVVELHKKKEAHPIHYASVGALDLPQRRGRPPLTVSAYYFLEPGIPHPTKTDAKLTRLDYTCEIHSQ